MRATATLPAATATFWLAVVAAVLVPFVERLGGPARAQHEDAFPGWPAAYEGRALAPLPLTPREDTFVRDFPGRVGRFSDGRREIIVRWVVAPTRRLHPASDCLRGIGHVITPLPVRIATDGTAMSCFRAQKGGAAMAVCEAIRDGRGGSWPDVSAWYWSALLGRERGPWWSFVVAEPL